MFMMVNYDVVGSSMRTHQKFAEKFVGSSSTDYRELARSLLEGCWELVGSSPKGIGSSLEVYQKSGVEADDLE
ncbi:hypothetical protein BHE74_00059696 [Ensete ventricosum]|nr:hypothetical protein BHE74_00059696 [Ensete ventricosum]